MSILPLALLSNLLIKSSLSKLLKLEDKFFNMLYVFILCFVVFFSKITGFEIGAIFKLNFSTVSWMKIVVLLSITSHFFTKKGLEEGVKLLAISVFLLSPSLPFLALSFLLFHTNKLMKNSHSSTSFPKILPLVLLVLLFVESKYFHVLSNIGLVFSFIYLFLVEQKKSSFLSLVASTAFIFKLIEFVEVHPIVIQLLSLVVFLSVCRIMRSMIKVRNRILDHSFKLFLVLAVCLPLFGEMDLFLLIISFVLIAKALFELTHKAIENIAWLIFAFLFVFSPPFGLGYVFKTYLYKVSLDNGIAPFVLVLISYLIVQIGIGYTLFKSIKNDWELIKDKKYEYSKSGFGILLVSVAASLLFIPIEWTPGLGNLYFRWGNIETPSTSLATLGYYLFWLEALICSLIVFIFSKLGVSRIKEIEYKLVSVKPFWVKEKSIPSTTTLTKPKNNLSDLIKVFNPKLDTLDNTNLTLVLVFLLSLFVLGVS